MRYSFNWLKDYLPGLKMAPKKMASMLTDAGVEVEEIIECGRGLQGIVVGEVTSVRPHPNADRLSLCTVTDGRESHAVVCGAKNVKEGGKYPFAKIGAVLPGGFEIKKAMIRGSESFGMLCSAKELGFAGSADGILELDGTCRPGRPFAEEWEGRDTVFAIGITPNRGDLLSHQGLAVEIAAVTGARFVLPGITVVKGRFPSRDFVRFQVKDGKGCHRYTSRIIRGVTVKPSPAWLVRRLKACDIRPINNIVDATNYVMLTTGHPVHAFDHRFLAGGKIIIRKAASSGDFKALDEKVYSLEKDDLVIADAEGPVALAGIIGGADSEIRNDTTVVVLEAAAFNPVRIRRTSRRLGLKTDSSYRFERGVAADTVKDALDQLVAKIVDLAGGEASADVIDLYPVRGKRRVITLRTDELRRVTGTIYSSQEVAKIFKSLGFLPKKSGRGFKVSVPSSRSDITREIDLIEEVVRLTGIDRIPPVLPSVVLKPVKEDDVSKAASEAKAYLVAHGYRETLHYSFVNKNFLKAYSIPGEGEWLELANPLSADQSVMRPSLLPHFISTFCSNSGSEYLRLFEIRPVYKQVKGRPSQEFRLGIFYGGAVSGNDWRGKVAELDFYHGKGLITEMLRFGGLSDIVFQPGEGAAYLHPGEQAEIRWTSSLFGTHELGVMGRLAHHVAYQATMQEKVFYYCDLNFKLIAKYWKWRSPQYRAVSAFPSVERDMALIADKGVPYQKIHDAITEARVPWLKKIRLFDYYAGEKLPSGKKSLGVRLLYENSERTLTDEEVNEVHFGLIQRLKDQLGIDLRT